MIMITHDLGIVAETCDRVAVMYAGRVIEEGNLDEVFNHTKHPYTEGLFNSLPNIKKQKEQAAANTRFDARSDKFAKGVRICAAL